MNEQEYVLSVKVSNNNGVLPRVGGLFSRRGYSIKSLNAAETEEPEHILIRAGNSAEDRHKIIEIANLYRAKPVDISANSIMLELTGEPAKIDSFLNLLKPFGIIKMVRSGITALERD